MRRKRYQNGSVRPRKHGKIKVWVAQWRDNGNKRSRVLGRCAEIPKSQAQAMLAQILQPINDFAGHRQVAVSTFKQYVETVFLPAYRHKWKESTRSTSEPDIMRYLVPVFGDQFVAHVTREQMQRFLEEKGANLSSSVVGHLRWHLNAIFKMAESDGLVEFNPATALFIRACRTAPAKRVMSKNEVRNALSILDLRERLIVRMAVFDGMRPGEIFAVQVGKVRSNSVVVDVRLYGSSNIDRPKGRKGKDTSRTVALPWYRRGSESLEVVYRRVSGIGVPVLF